MPEVPDRIIGNTGQDRRDREHARVGSEQRIAVGDGTRGELGRDGAAGTGLVVDDDRLAQGFGQDREEFDDHIRCAAIPIFDRMNQVVAGLSVNLGVLSYWLARRLSQALLLRSTGAKLRATHEPP